MPKTHTVQIIVERPKEYRSEDDAWAEARKMVEDLKRQYPGSNVEPHVWTNG